MNRQTILFISDMRQVYLAEIMTKRGLNVRCLDIRNSGTVKEQLEKLKSFLAEADMLILPIRWCLEAASRRNSRNFWSAGTFTIWIL